MRALCRFLSCAIAIALVYPALAAPDEDILGKAGGYPVGTPKNWFYDEHVRVGSFSHIDKVLPHYFTVHKSAAPLPLPKAASMPKLDYRFEGQTYTIDDFLAHQRITGLLVIKDGRILDERYQYDRKDSDRFISHSMAKSITSLAIGIALAEKKIASLDDTVAKYEPKLAGSPYGETTIRNILRMSSGVPFDESYDGRDDLTRFSVTRFKQDSVAALRELTTREVEQGTRFHYASSETVALVLVLRATTGTSLTEYLTPRLWQPMGRKPTRTGPSCLTALSSAWATSMQFCATMAGSASCSPMTERPAASRSFRRSICSMPPTGIGNLQHFSRSTRRRISAMATSSGCFPATSAGSRCSASTASRSSSTRS